MTDWFAIQTRLKELGFVPGAIDGIFGRQTRSAVIAFQQANKVPVKWPGTVGALTLKALFPEGGTPLANPIVGSPWLDVGISKKGLLEGRNYAELSRFLKSDGKTLGDPRTLPWCGDFIETCIALALPEELLPNNPYLARNWLEFGRPTEPTLGSILVFWRGRKGGTSGHVTFAVGQSASNYYCLGGNQSNSVSVTPIGKKRLLGARWPLTSPRPNIYLAAAVGGVVSINEA